MKHTKKLRTSVIALDFDEVVAELRRQQASPEDTVGLVALIRQTGCLLVAYADGKREILRDAFIVSLSNWLLDARCSQAAKELHDHVAQVRRCEVAFRAILSALIQSPTGKASPHVSAWATLFAVAKDVTEVSAAAASAEPHMIADDLAFVSSEMLRVSALGHDGVDPDVVAERYALNLAGYLKMLGYRHGWFRDGEVVIPAQVPVPDELLRDRSSLFLAETWNQLDYHWELVRYFDSSSAKTEVRSYNTEDRRLEINTLHFEHDWQYLLDVEIARSRLRRQIFEVTMHVVNERRTSEVIRDPTHALVPLSPAGFISIHEAIALLVLDMCYGLDLKTNQTEYHGLRLTEWLRGYALLQLCCQREVALAPIARGISYLTTKTFLELARQAGMERVRAAKFLDQATFQKNSRDLWDAPLIRTADGRYIIVPCLFSHCALHEALTSRLNSLLLQVTNKGPNFEEEVRKHFTDLGATSKRVQYETTEGRFECDAVVVWDRELLLVECKAYTLPQSSGSDLYYFRQRQREAADQISRIERHFNEDPTILQNAFGRTLDVSRTTTCVMNLAPFCMPGEHHKTKFYDRGALGKFSSGEITAVVLGPNGDSGRGRAESVIANLWEGEEPAPNDLIAQMDRPYQYLKEKPMWAISERTVGLSPELVMVCSFWERRPDQVSDML